MKKFNFALAVFMISGTVQAATYSPLARCVNVKYPNVILNFLYNPENPTSALLNVQVGEVVGAESMSLIEQNGLYVFTIEPDSLFGKDIAVGKTLSIKKDPLTTELLDAREAYTCH